ncbi:MAG: hypothetical protein H6819_10645 [Phycisphaerales bacterium]|nr:hypothetical protein [Phycisphaerales bacterium]MCB9854395.1 hypothetical protein [Phycisphaerales bacterium]MCB9863596.1 hypothetical protein [Phycisphaerales bacterium]
MSGRIARIVAIVTIAFAWLAPTLQAATITVDTLVDENDGVGTGGISLRDAITEANANGQDDTIDFSVTGTITLTADLPSITTNMAVEGPGLASMTIHGDDQFRIFVVRGSSTTLSLSGLTLAHALAAGGNGGSVLTGGGGGGAAGMGAALFVDDGHVTLDSLLIEDNQSVGGDGGMTNGTGSIIAGGGGGGLTGDASFQNAAAGGFLGGSAGAAGSPGGAGGDGAGGGGGFSPGLAGGAAGFGGGGGGGGYGDSMISATGGVGGAGGFGGGGGGAGRNDGGGASPAGGIGGMHGGSGGTGSNSSQGFGGGGAGLGGAIFVRAGALEMLDCTFNRNTATGGSSGGGDATDGEGKGGAIYVDSGATVAEFNTTHGTGGNANSASDDSASSGDDDDVYGTILAIPVVQSMTRQGSNPSNESQVTYHVTFSEAVTGVNSSDFAVVMTGISGASVSSTVTDVGSGSVYAVTINTGTGSGSVALRLVDDDSIENSSNVKLGGTGTGNGDFTASSVFAIDKTKPIAESIEPSETGPTNADTLTFAVTFDDAVTDFNDGGDVQVEHDGTAHKGIAITQLSDTDYVVTVSGITGDGELSLYVKANAAADDTGNLNAIAGPSDAVTIDNTPPAFETLSAPEGLDADSRLVFSIEFSESVTGFASDDVTVNHDGTAHESVTIESISSTAYRVIVTGVSGEGSVSIAIAANAVTDAAENGNAAATSPAVTISNADNGGNDNSGGDNGGGVMPGVGICGAAPLPMLAILSVVMFLTRRHRCRRRV